MVHGPSHLTASNMEDMPGMTTTSSSSMTGGMSMVFTTDHRTPLFSAAWTPTSPAAYAGTCIFLVVLAVISRLLLAYRSDLEATWHARAVNRRYITVAGETQADRERQNGLDEKADEATLTTRGLDERVRVVRTARSRVQGAPWRFSTDLPRACIFTVQAGVGYLLCVTVPSSSSFASSLTVSATACWPS